MTLSPRMLGTPSEPSHHFREMDDEVDPSLRGAVHTRVREEHEVHMAHTRGATSRLELAGAQTTGMQTRTRIQLPRVARGATAGGKGANEAFRAGRIGLAVVLSLALGREVTVVGSTPCLCCGKSVLRRLGSLTQR